MGLQMFFGIMMTPDKNVCAFFFVFPERTSTRWRQMWSTSRPNSTRHVRSERPSGLMLLIHHGKKPDFIHLAENVSDRSFFKREEMKGMAVCDNIGFVKEQSRAGLKS